ncbi:MAG: hypothetical protein WCK05_05695, partial [Planctomycetota bacterium]
KLFGGRDPNLLAKSSVGNLYRKDLEIARQDLEILGGQILQQYVGGVDAVAALTRSNPDKSDAALTGWMLLLQEAQKAGMVPSPEETRTQLQVIVKERGGTDDTYTKFLAELRNMQPPVGEKMLLQSASHWLGIERYFQVQLPSGPGLEAEQKALFRDLTEQANLRVVVLQPEPFLSQAGTPTQTEIERLFALYKDKVPGTAPTSQAFGFGYRLGDRVKVRYLAVSAEAIHRASAPDKSEISDYFLKHSEEFLLPTATAPATAATSRPATAATMAFYDARPLIIETLRPRVARSRMDELVSRLNRDAKALAGKVADPLAQVYAAQLVDAKANQAILDKPLPADVVNVIHAMPIDPAMDVLAKAAGLAGICFPWGSYREFAIAPNVLVTLSCPEGKAMTLAAALDEVAQQVLPKQALPAASQPAAPKLTWAAVKGVGDPKVANGAVLYCIQSNVGVALFPFQLDATDLIERPELLENPVLSSCRTGRDEGDSLTDLAFALVSRKTEGLAAAEIKPVGKEMSVVYQATGESDLVDRVLWQTVETSPSQAPATITPRIQKQIVTDWQTQAVFENQMKALAAKLADEAKTGGLAEAAKKLNAPATWETGLFSRLSYIAPSPDRIEVIPLNARVQQMTPAYLDMACKMALTGDVRAIVGMLSPMQRRALNDRLQGLFATIRQQIDTLTPGAEDKAPLMQQLITAMYSAQGGDYRLLIRLANQALPNGRRLGGEQVNALRSFVLPVEMAVLAAKKWNLSLLSVTMADDAKPMYLLGRIGHLDSVKKLLADAFLPPANIEAPLAELDKPGPVVTLAVPASGMIVVFQRIGYRPPVAAEFASVSQGDKPDRAKIASYLFGQRLRAARGWWFNYPNTVERLSYKPERD